MTSSAVEEELKNLLKDVTDLGDLGHCGWVDSFEQFEENYRILSGGVSFVTRTSRKSSR